MRRLLIGLLVAGFAMGSAWAQTASRLEEIVARGTLRVGLTGDYQPYSVLDKSNGQYVGIDVDMANALASTLGVKLAIVPTSWRDLAADVKAGQFDIAMGGIPVALDLQKAAFFSNPVIRTGKAALVRCTAKTRFYSLATIDRPGVRVLVNPGGTNERFVQTNINYAAVKTFTERTPILEELSAGRADVIIMDVFMPNRDGLDALRELQSRPETENIPVILLSARPELPERIRPAELGAATRAWARENTWEQRFKEAEALVDELVR